MEHKITVRPAIALAGALQTMLATSAKDFDDYDAKVTDVELVGEEATFTITDTPLGDFAITVTPI